MSNMDGGDLTEPQPVVTEDGDALRVGKQLLRTLDEAFRYGKHVGYNEGYLDGSRESRERPPVASEEKTSEELRREIRQTSAVLRLQLALRAVPEDPIRSEWWRKVYDAADSLCCILASTASPEPDMSDLE